MLRKFPQSELLDPEDLSLCQRVFEQACIDDNLDRSCIDGQILASTVLRLFQAGCDQLAQCVTSLKQRLLALLGNNAEDRTYTGSASVVVNKLNRDLFWQAVELLTDPDKKTPDKLTDNITRWLKPGLVGRIRHLAGSDLRHATVMSVWLEGGR